MNIIVGLEDFCFHILTCYGYHGYVREGYISHSFSEQL